MNKCITCQMMIKAKKNKAEKGDSVIFYRMWKEGLSDKLTYGNKEA